MDIEGILQKMSLEDKIALCSGKNFWQTKAYEQYGIPSLFMSDGPHGLRKQEEAEGMSGVNISRKSTCFPAEVTTAGSWDTALLERIGAAVAEEAKHQKVGLVLGPGCNIKRNPLCGRNFEYFSEDPYLSGKLAGAFICGLEQNGVGTSLKHFACNSQETARFTSDGVVDERTLREIYLTGFEIAVKQSNPATLMCSYPKINGIHASNHKYLLTDILRGEWGFEGAVITDWGAMSDRMEGFRAGCDLSMPGGSDYMEKACALAVAEGKLDEEDINTSVRRILKLVERGVKAMTGEPCDYEAHNALAEEAAASGAVLLKNEGRILPLNKAGSLAVIGHMAKQMRYQGAGSSHINATQLSQPLEFLPGCSYALGCDENGATTEALLEQAKKVAAEAEAAVVFAGLPDKYESEGFDRTTLKMPEGQLQLIDAVAAVNPNTIVVLFCGSAVECPWADKVKAILYMGLPGQAGGAAAAKLLFGEVVPSGRLAESWPLRYEDVPSAEYYAKTEDALYEEGIYVGYRYYEKAGIPVRWSFGHGLSYTTFSYSDLKVEGDSVSVTVTNTGSCDGAETVLLYVQAPQTGLHRPLRELKGFDKLFLKQGESKTATFALSDRSFAVYSEGWKIPAGSYEISVGGLTVSVEKEGEKVPAPAWQAGSFYETCKGKPVQAEWEAMLGKKYAPVKTKKGEYTLESTIEEMREHSLVMKLLYQAIDASCRKTSGSKDPENPEYIMLLNSTVGGPIRSTCILHGKKDRTYRGLVDIANGHYLRGIATMLKG